MPSSPVYQGQEQHFNGSETPHNREPLWQSGYDKTAPLYVHTANMLKLRKNAMKLSPDYLESYSETIRVDQNHLCLKKGPSGSQIVFCITNKSSAGNAYDDTLSEAFGANDKVVEVVSCKTVTADATGSIPLFMDKGEPKVYVLESALEGTGLCPSTEPDASKMNAGSILGVSKMALAVAAGWLAVFML